MSWAVNVRPDEHGTDLQQALEQAVPAARDAAGERAGWLADRFGVLAAQGARGVAAAARELPAPLADELAAAADEGRDPVFTAPSDAVFDLPDGLADQLAAVASALVSPAEWGSGRYRLSASGGLDASSDTRSLIVHVFPRGDAIT